MSCRHRRISFINVIYKKEVMVAIYLILVFVIVPIIASIEALMDTHKWFTQDKEIEHAGSMSLRICGGIITTFIYCDHHSLDLLTVGIPVLISSGACYWTVFDLITNLRSKRHLLAIGSTATIDRISKQYGKELVFTFKLITLLCSTYLTLHQI
jgi:hypothetical protein